MPADAALAPPPYFDALAEGVIMVRAGRVVRLNRAVIVFLGLAG